MGNRGNASRTNVVSRIFAWVCALWASAADTARADPSSWQLTWQAPEACPSAQVVRETVQAWLAQASEPHDTARIHVLARVRTDPAGFALDLTLTSQTGQIREQLLAAECKTFAGVIGLKVALAADPGAPLEPPSSTPPPPSLHAALRLASGAAAGTLPSTSMLVSLAGSLRIARLELELGAGYQLPAQARLPIDRAVTANFDSWYGTARACLLPVLSNFEFSVCAGADYGRVRGRGEVGLLSVRTSSQPWAALAISPGLRWQIAPGFAIWLGIDALLQLVRPAFRARLQSSGALVDLYTPAVFGGRLQLGAEFRMD